MVKFLDQQNIVSFHMLVMKKCAFAETCQDSVRFCSLFSSTI